MAWNNRKLSVALDWPRAAGEHAFAMNAVLDLYDGDVPDVPLANGADRDAVAADLKEILPPESSTDTPSDPPPIFSITIGTGCTFRPEPDGLYIWADESADIELLVALLQTTMRRFGIAEPVTIEWAETCSKPQPGEFGGGFVVFDRDRAEWGDTKTLAKQAAQRLLGTTDPIGTPLGALHRIVEIHADPDAALGRRGVTMGDAADAMAEVARSAMGGQLPAAPADPLTALAAQLEFDGAAQEIPSLPRFDD